MICCAISRQTMDGKKAVKEKLIDQLGGISDALEWLYREIERTE